MKKKLKDQELESRDTKKQPLLLKDGKPFNIPAEGSLGLLALGYAGLLAWREKRKQHSLELYKQTRH